jgi:hypothetical protein
LNNIDRFITTTTTTNIPSPSSSLNQ